MIKIYKVQSASLADGVYTCVEQSLAAAAWEAGHGDKFEDATAGDPPVVVPPVEVLNLLESSVGDDYTRALAVGDRIMAWSITDFSGSSVLVGKPITPDVRMARTTEAGGGSTHITCNLIANDGETEIESGLGSGIEVYFKTINAANMNQASPRFKNDDYLFAENINGKWFFVDVPDRCDNCYPPEE